MLGCTTPSDGNHLPAPSPVGQARTIERLLKRSGLELEAIDFISARATSTPQGDISELSAIKAVFGDHAKRLRGNAPKSLLGHTCWSAPAVETVAGLLQMKPWAPSPFTQHRQYGRERRFGCVCQQASGPSDQCDDQELLRIWSPQLLCGSWCSFLGGS
ncbi:hypothetical protein [Microvirga sp. 2TAF3]|uniref:hypothetical protein n=1 Tax=Microvirga sp. 2TAF3 TaxID=3233014 RepID=UPI003F9DF50D